jgi:hypothetical protein
MSSIIILKSQQTPDSSSFSVSKRVFEELQFVHDSTSNFEGQRSIPNFHVLLNSFDDELVEILQSWLYTREIHISYAEDLLIPCVAMSVMLGMIEFERALIQRLEVMASLDIEKDDWFYWKLIVDNYVPALQPIAMLVAPLAFLQQNESVLTTMYELDMDDNIVTKVLEERQPETDDEASYWDILEKKKVWDILEKKKYRIIFPTLADYLIGSGAFTSNVNLRILNRVPSSALIETLNLVDLSRLDPVRTWNKLHVKLNKDETTALARRILTRLHELGAKLPKSNFTSTSQIAFVIALSSVNLNQYDLYSWRHLMPRMDLSYAGLSAILPVSNLTLRVNLMTSAKPQVRAKVFIDGEASILWIARHVRGILIDTLAHALDVNVQSSYDGNSILHILAARRETALIREVMSIPGVDTSLLNHNQETAEFIARKGGDEDMGDVVRVPRTIKYNKQLANELLQNPRSHTR